MSLIECVCGAVKPIATKRVSFASTQHIRGMQVLEDVLSLFKKCKIVNLGCICQSEKITVKRSLRQKLPLFNCVGISFTVFYLFKAVDYFDKSKSVVALKYYKQ